MGNDYQLELGRRLRAIRDMQGRTLQDVERDSDGRWKAVVVGSWERGDRAISVAKLERLARFYGVPIWELLPSTTPQGDPVTDVTDDGLRIDLTALDPEADGTLGAISRYAQRVQIHRGDYNGRQLTIRAADVEAIADACGVTVIDLVDELVTVAALQR